IAKKYLSIQARLTGKRRKLSLSVFYKHTERQFIGIGEFISGKLIAMRVSAVELYIMLRALQDCFMEAAGTRKPEDVEMVLYHSDKCNKPCVGVMVKGIPQKTLVLSQVLEIIDDGSALLN